MELDIDHRLCVLSLIASFLLASITPPAHGQTVVRYIHTDALGTPVLTTDSEGKVIEENIYDPYGNQLSGTKNSNPGYAGHVTDSETDLVYMQQRYYDSQIGVFLSADPVVAADGAITHFNRYRYANNNPYIFNDPDGRDVKYAYVNGITQQTGRMHMASIAMSPSARDELRRLEESPHLYTIEISGTGLPSYNPNTRTIYLNPNIAILTKEKGVIQPPEVNSSHEISHGAEHDRAGDEKFGEAMRDVESNGTRREENRANSFEKKVGDELGVPTRENYKDVERTIDCKKTPMTGC